MDKNIKTYKNDLEHEERKVADKVADELLDDARKEKRMILFFLMLLIFMVFTLSYLIFSRFALFTDTTENVINSGKIIFSYEEGKNAINIRNALPTSDEVGKNLDGVGNYFEFFVAADVNSAVQDSITYEVSLTPKAGTLDGRYVRILLLKDGEEVKINGKTVNKFSELNASKVRPEAKFLYKKEVSGEHKAEYVFKMWVGEDYEIDGVARTFSCFVNIDAY